MMLARPLLRTSRYRVPAPEAFQLLAAPKGGGVISPDPKSYYHDGKTHFAWVNGSTGGVEVATYDHATKTVSASNELVNFPTGIDTHDLLALMVRKSDSKLMTAYCGHRLPNMNIRVSLNANDTTGAWPSASNIDSQIGGNSYTYPSFVQLRGVTNDPIYLFYRDHTPGATGRMCYSVSTDDGATWSAQTVLYFSSTEYLSWRIGSDWESRIDIVVDDGDAYTADTSLYHFYIDGTDGSLHKSDGTTIVASLPLVPADITLIEDGAAGAARPSGTILVDGNPVIVYFVELDASTNSVRWARWTGSAWEIEEIVQAGVHPADRFSTGLTIAFDDPYTVYLGDLVSGTIELFRYRRIGGVWQGDPVTVGSPAHNAQVQSVHFGIDSLPAIWFQGTLTDATSFNMSTMGMRLA